jgi:hypothetical protein
MKQILTTLSITLVIMIATRCNQNSPAPSNGGSSNGTNNTTTMTPLETSLVGSWKLKRTEQRLYIYNLGLGDSTCSYTNHYNYFNSILELKSNSIAGLLGYYEGSFGVNDYTFPEIIYWKGGPSNSIVTAGSQLYFNIKHLSTDSLVIDLLASGVNSIRYFYNKNNIPPIQNNIEVQLIGSPWQLTSQNGGTAPQQSFKQFFSNWYSDDGYYSEDSFNISPSGFTPNWITGPSNWQVLYPNRSVPILKMNESEYYKITNLTANSLRIEQILPTLNAQSTSTLIYSR